MKLLQCKSIFKNFNVRWENVKNVRLISKFSLSIDSTNIYIYIYIYIFVYIYIYIYVCMYV